MLTSVPCISFNVCGRESCCLLPLAYLCQSLIIYLICIASCLLLQGEVAYRMERVKAEQGQNWSCLPGAHRQGGNNGCEEEGGLEFDEDGNVGSSDVMSDVMSIGCESGGEGGCEMCEEVGWVRGKDKAVKRESVSEAGGSEGRKAGGQKGVSGGKRGSVKGEEEQGEREGMCLLPSGAVMSYGECLV